ncbi:MAG: DUF4476 domain-containing protein [Bacteroidia bacterium]|nr:DUF4476 domain-containing protein [Bacteroidia bacterium]
MNKYYLTICLLLLSAASITAADLTIRTDAALTFAVEIPGRVARTAYRSSHTLTRLPDGAVELYVYYAPSQTPLVFEEVPLEPGALTTYDLVISEEGNELRYAGAVPFPSRTTPPYPPGNGGSSYEPAPRPAYDASLFTDLMTSLRTRYSDQARLALIRQALPDLAPTSEQVRDLLALLSFESSRKSLALEAYEYVRDPELYVIIVTSFDFASTVEEVAIHCMRQGPLVQVDRGYTRACDAATFELAKQLVDDQSFDKTKILLGKWVLHSLPVSSRQVAALMDLYSFDQSRLEIAKAAYPFVLDPERYFVVWEAFDFESTGRQLDAFVKTSRRE